MHLGFLIYIHVHVPQCNRKSLGLTSTMYVMIKSDCSLLVTDDMQVVLRTMLEAFCGDQHSRIELHLLLAETLILGLGQDLVQLHIDPSNYMYLLDFSQHSHPCILKYFYMLVCLGLCIVLLLHAIIQCLAAYIYSDFWHCHS